MVLTEVQAKLFYDLWIPLLDFVNRKYKLCKDFYGMDSPKGLPLDVVRNISGKLWENTSVIDEYISKNVQNMSEEHISIVRGWKKVVHGKFVVERHLKNGSILVSCDEDGSVYRVRGIYSSWRELLGTLPMPQIVETSLIPFQDVIIHDGIVMPYGVFLGKNMADQARHMYMNAKEQKRIIECI
ncbi:MAG: hypothetical protein ACOCM4_10685 [Acetivibrio ethanolgignens]